MVELLEQAKKVAELIRNSNYVVALTGPAISSGDTADEDYQAANRLWTMVSPDDFSISRFKSDPDSYYDLGAPYFSLLYQAKPSEAHYALANMEKKGLLAAIITQNIDGLHREAGSKKVYEIHGTIKTATCVHCGGQHNVEDVVEDITTCSFPLQCPSCGEPLKPDLYLEGDTSAPDYDKAMAEAGKADLMLIIGSRMQVAPDNRIPAVCKKLVVIHREETFFDEQAVVLINDDPGKALKLIEDQLNEGRKVES